MGNEAVKQEFTLAFCSTYNTWYDFKMTTERIQTCISSAAGFLLFSKCFCRCCSWTLRASPEPRMPWKQWWSQTSGIISLKTQERQRTRGQLSWNACRGQLTRCGCTGWYLPFWQLCSQGVRLLGQTAPCPPMSPIHVSHGFITNSWKRASTAFLRGWCPAALSPSQGRYETIFWIWEHKVAHSYEFLFQFWDKGKPIPNSELGNVCFRAQAQAQPNLGSRPLRNLWAKVAFSDMPN